jgi:hypothetical protein
MPKLRKAIEEEGDYKISVVGPSQKPIGFGRSRPDADEYKWGTAYTIEPPLDPDALLILYANSDTLQQCVAAMVNNIAGRGHVYEAVIDFDSPDSMEQVATEMVMERQHRHPGAPMPTEQEVEEQHAAWKREAKLERAQIEVLINRLTPGRHETFRRLRKDERRDRESVGWGAWEIIRQNGIPVRARHVPARSLRLTDALRIHGEDARQGARRPGGDRDPVVGRLPP